MKIIFLFLLPPNPLFSLKHFSHHVLKPNEYIQAYVSFSMLIPVHMSTNKVMVNSQRSLVIHTDYYDIKMWLDRNVTRSFYEVNE